MFGVTNEMLSRISLSKHCPTLFDATRFYKGIGELSTSNVNDIYFTIIHSLTLPIACTFGDAFIIFASGFWSSKFFISYYAATFTQTLPMLMHIFIFRYFVIKRTNLVPIYTWFNTVLIIFFTVGAEATIWCGGSYILYETDQLSREYIKPFFEMYNYPDLEREETLGFIGLQFFSDDMGKWSNRTRLLQRRLFNILIVQLAVPMFFVYFPCSSLISLPMLHTGLNIYPNLGPCSLTIFPMLDALIIIIGVPSY
ncbi:hypothetical protein PRIPAC_96054, partial [Pristionchus pacificus]|uniref:G protein-coupled receptor n=1 Tax=Pristionchus pacificus TaxID=54126 RepID=A0A2A6BBX2_PRIPA